MCRMSESSLLTLLIEDAVDARPLTMAVVITQKQRSLLFQEISWQRGNRGITSRCTGTYEYAQPVKVEATSALDVSDMLRAALVLAVRALDYYVHEVVTLGMLEIHRGQ